VHPLRTYKPVSIERDRYHLELEAFLVEVLTVDYERKNLTVIDLRSGVPYQEVNIFPANHSSNEGTDVHMPEPGSRGVAVPLNSRAGFFEIAIVSWVVSDTNRAQQGIATRAIDIPEMQGWNKRTRGSYRKAFAGQQTTTLSEGYSQKTDDGWDRLAADFSRDHLDPQRRQWTEIAARKVRYSDGGVAFEGSVNRPGAAGVGSDLLPDGTSQAVVYLAPGATLASRYVSGSHDVIPIAERTVKVQEYALDFAVPEEALGTPLLDQILGVNADPWARTTVQQTGAVSHDDQTFMIDQTWDNPTNSKAKAVGPTLNEGPTPRRRGYIMECSEGTLVGSNLFDASTYGQILKPVVFPYTTLGRFGTDVESGYLPVVLDQQDHVQTRIAASALSVRFTHEANTTRWDVTKEGFTSFEIGSTLPKENIPLAGDYEHPHGAGRSLEGHLVGSMKLVVGKNRDEEDSIDLQALGQSVLRLGADDASLPNVNRTVMTQMRGQSDAVQDRALQYWASAKLIPGDAGNLQSKTGAENISLRGAFDGGTVLRLGARNTASMRRHIMNGYADGPGVQRWAPGDPSRVDSKSPGRPTYGAGDMVYRFHDLTQVGQPQLNLLPYYWSGSPVTNMDAHGLSLDVHAVQDVLLRVGKNPASGQSLLLDLAGGLVAALGKDNQGRSVTASLDGGVELTIGPSQAGKALRIEFRGDIDWTVKGNFHLHVTGDTVFESTAHQHIVKTDYVTKAQTMTQSALARITIEAPDIVHNQGLYTSNPD
jgi:hypothetical protein